MAAKLCKRDCSGGGGGLSLPEDIILEVLLKLPAKALCRFQCISRPWRALISDQAFVAALRSRATGPLIVAVYGHKLRLLDKGGNILMVFDVMEFDDRGRRAWLAPTCLDRIFVVRPGRLGAMIIDPASGHDLTIVGTNDAPPPSWDNSAVMHISDYSFGRATASGDYKVLCLSTSSYLPNRRCQVATIMDGVAKPTWRQRPLGPFYPTSFSFEDKATINGVLYFMLHHSKSHGRKHIAAFDLDNEEWKPNKIKGPLLGHKDNNDKWHIALTNLKGNLCMVHNVQYLADLIGHYADIWLLKDPYTCVWVKEYKIKMPAERFLVFTKPLDVLTDGKLLLLNGFKKERNTKNCDRYILQHYNSSTKGFTDLMEMAPGFNGEMAFYTGSLQSQHISAGI